jgi:lipid A disaccharide synthetase
MNPLRVALVAGEHSGDQLGAKLMQALREARAGEAAFLGVGGEAMEAEGLKSLFPISDIAVMGILLVLARLLKVLARIRETAETIIAARPAALAEIARDGPARNAQLDALSRLDRDGAPRRRRAQRPRRARGHGDDRDPHVGSVADFG